MANITQLTTITTVTNTTTFVVINNSSTRRVSFLTIKNQLLNETGRLSSLSDVNSAGLADGNILRYNTSTSKWIVGSTPSGSLSGLTDVSVGGVTDGQILAYDADSDQWIASSNVAATSLADLTDVTILETPLDGQVLKYNSENDKWLPGTDNAGSGIGLSSRTTAFGVTSNLASNATGNISITGFKSYSLLKMQTSAAAWVRLYTTSAARTNDSARAQTTDPTPGSGVIAEVITSGAQTQLMTPGIFGFNDDTIITSTIYAAVTNLSGAGSGTYTVTNSGSIAYTINSESNPTLTLQRGGTYTFNISASGHPFRIQTSSGAYISGNSYDTGVTNNGTASGTITFTVPNDAPSTLYYVCQNHSNNMRGIINIVAAGQAITVTLTLVQLEA